MPSSPNKLAGQRVQCVDDFIEAMGGAAHHSVWPPAAGGYEH